MTRAVDRRVREDRILWNTRPEGKDAGCIDEIVMHDVALVHIEQMDDRCWWIALYKGGTEDPYWMGNFHCDSAGRMRFTEQDDEIEWDMDEAHDER